MIPLGILGSARIPASPPSGDAEIIQVAYSQGLNAAAITATPEPGDILVLFGASNGNVNISGVSGCGAAWSQLANYGTAGAGDRRHVIWVGSDPASAGSVTPGWSGANYPHQWVYLIRGAGQVVSDSRVHAPWAAFPRLGPAMAAGSGQLVVALADNYDSTNPGLQATPADGWTQDKRNSMTFQASVALTRAPDATGSHRIDITSGNQSGTSRITTAVIGA